MTHTYKIYNYLQPFPHTIIYDVFDSMTLDNVIKEIKIMSNTGKQTGGEHHLSLYKEGNTKTINLAEFYQTQLESYIMNSIFFDSNCLTDYLAKYSLTLECRNSYLKYFATLNSVSTHIQLYEPGSTYYPHQDNSVITLLHILWLDEIPIEPQSELVFFIDSIYDINYEKNDSKNIEFGYKYKFYPKMKHNSAIIFPGYEFHSVENIKYKRASINSMFNRTN